MKVYRVLEYDDSGRPPGWLQMTLDGSIGGVREDENHPYGRPPAVEIYRGEKNPLRPWTYSAANAPEIGKLVEIAVYFTEADESLISTACLEGDGSFWASNEGWTVEAQDVYAWRPIDDPPPLPNNKPEKGDTEE